MNGGMRIDIMGYGPPIPWILPVSSFSDVKAGEEVLRLDESTGLSTM